MEEEGQGRGEKGSLEEASLELRPGGAELGRLEIPEGHSHVGHKGTGWSRCFFLLEKEAHVPLGLGLKLLQLGGGLDVNINNPWREGAEATELNGNWRLLLSKCF